MNDAQAFLVAGHIAPSAGIDEKAAVKCLRRSVGRSGFEGYGIGFRGETRHGPAFTHFRAEGCGVLEKNMIEGGALDLDGFGFARKAALAKNELGGLAAVPEMKLRSEFFGKSRRIQCGGHAQF